MDYKIKQYEITTNKNMNNNETRIITLSDLNLHKDISKYDMNDLIVTINDLYPKYLFILGNITDYNNLHDKYFQKKLDYFFNLLSTITKTYLVFGKKDYEIKDSNNIKYVNIEQLLYIYNQFKVYPINNCLYVDTDINIVGLNLEPNSHFSNEEKIKKIKELIDKYNSLIDKSMFNILITHADLNFLNHNKGLLNFFNLIFSKESYSIPKPSIFNIKSQEKKDQIFSNFIIENKGVNNKEIDFIKIKKL